MTCSTCQTDNADDSRFCEACGSALEQRCAHCGKHNRPSARFCRACGSELRQAAPAEAPRQAAAPAAAYTPQHLVDKILHSRSALEGERKQVTVFFADVKGSMDLSEQVDAEEWHRIMDRFFHILAEGVHRFEGTINQYTGDGIMALFGAPIAHEDHAQRACFAALHVRDELRRYADELRRSRGLNFLVRIGINTGDVVVGKIGDDLRMDYTAQGHTVGLAARMEQLAQPGRPLLTEYTAQLIRGYFRLQELGEASVKGVSEPLHLYELEDVGDLQTRFDLSRARGLTRFVGRDPEMHALEAALEYSLRGNGRIIAIVADAGTGKSRLCFELAKRCRARGIEVNEVACVAHGRTIPFLPLIEHFRRVFGIRRQDRSESARQKVAGALTLLDPTLQDTLPLWFDFLGITDPTRPLPRLDPDVRQRKFVAAIRRLFRARAQALPSVLIFEDLQWADAASESLLQNLVEVLAESPMLLVLNYRPEYHSAWLREGWEKPSEPSDAFFRILPLAPLKIAAVRQLLDDLIGPDPALGELRVRVHERTAGNPFFIEEVIRSLYNDGILVNEAPQGAPPRARLTRALKEIHIPASVRAVLAARIDRLSDRQKTVLQTAAVIGKEFSANILGSVLEEEGFDGDLGEDLSQLVGADFLWETALYPDAEYAFKHPLTHHVAYYAQLRDRRVRVHGAIARALIAVDPEEVDTRAALIAHHFEGADEMLEAARWSRKAAEWLVRSDPAQAQVHWRKVRDLTLALPSSAERDALVVHAGTQIIIVGVRLGLAEEEARAVFETARAVGEAAGDRRGLAHLHNAYGMLSGMSGLGDAAVQSIMEAERYAVEIEDHETLVALRVTVGVWLLHRGQVADALLLIEQGIDLTGGDPGFAADAVGFSPLAFLTLYHGVVRSVLGDIDAARADIEAALEMARQRDESELECLCLGFVALLAYYSGDTTHVMSIARQTMDLATRLGSPFIMGWATGVLGTAHRMREEWDAAISVLKAELAITRERRTGLLVEAVAIANLALAYLGKGDAEKALRTVTQAIEVARERGSRVFECDALLAKAEVLIRLRDPADLGEVEDMLAQAQTILEDTGAVSRQPAVHEQRAKLALACGDRKRWKEELRAALHGYTSLGAHGHAERLQRDLRV